MSKLPKSCVWSASELAKYTHTSRIPTLNLHVARQGSIEVKETEEVRGISYRRDVVVKPRGISEGLSPIQSKSVKVSHAPDIMRSDARMDRTFSEYFQSS